MIRELPYAHHPREVSIETLALCNAACVFCPYPTLARKGAQLDSVILYELLDQMREWKEPFFFSPFKVNEPLLDVRLEQICQTFVEICPQARLRLFTNGQPLTGRHMDWIQALPYGRVEHVWISLNSTNAQEYGDLMKCSFSIVLEHLNELHTRVVKGQFKHPVVVSRVVQGALPDQARNQQTFPPVMSVLSDTDCQFARDALIRWPRFQIQLIKRDSWLGYVTPSDPRVPNHPCARWQELSITAECKAVLCCMDGKGEYVLGDVRDQSLLEIYNSPTAKAYREQTGRRGGLAPCSGCSY